MTLTLGKDRKKGTKFGKRISVLDFSPFFSLHKACHRSQLLMHTQEFILNSSHELVADIIRQNFESDVLAIQSSDSPGIYTFCQRSVKFDTQWEIHPPETNFNQRHCSEGC
jgi:hypothetical protein